MVRFFIQSTLLLDSRSNERNIAHEEDKQLGIEANSERHEVTTLAIKTELRTYARQRWPLENDKSRKSKLRRALDLTARRMKSFWEGEETAVPRGHETARIENLIGHKIGAAAELKEAQHEYRDLAQLANSLHALLYGPEADFYRPQVDAIRAALLPQGGSPATSGGDPGTGNQGREG
jgi:hypothetical protein